MSKTQEADEAQEVAAGLIPLLKEYTAKLDDLNADLDKIERGLAISAKNSTTLAILKRESQDRRDAFLRLLPSARDMIRKASQCVQHGKAKELTRLELSLRLAEFEGIEQAIEKRVKYFSFK